MSLRCLKADFEHFRWPLQVAVGNIHAYVPRHVWPPVALGDELQGFEAAWVSSHLGVMAERDYPAAEVRSVRDVDATMVVEEAIVFRPFRGSEGAGGRLL